MKVIFYTFMALMTLSIKSFSQSQDSVTLNYGQLYGLALNQDIQAVLKCLDTANISAEKDVQFKTAFEERFKFTSDQSDYFTKNDTTFNPLNRIYQDYWRQSLLNNDSSYDKYLENKLIEFFKTENAKNKFRKGKIRSEKLDDVFKNYVKSKGYHTTGYGRVGSLQDLLVWTTEQDTTYKIQLIDDSVEVKVVFMKDFISLGWEEYATLGKLYPGGWATDEALFCVKKAYDIDSESFLVNYLSHEGQHFSDYKHFPKLTQKDLEYRAKLIELSLGNDNIYKIIGSFIISARYDKNNAHPFSNYCIIRDMSKILFDNELEKDLEKWEKLAPEDINEAAKSLLIKSTQTLNDLGKDTVTESIK